MLPCRLFHCLSSTVWDAIERSYSYYNPNYDGVLEPSITDFLLSVIHKNARAQCVVYVPQELVTGADLDLIVMGQGVKGAHFRMQAKKLKRDEKYKGLNHHDRNNNYQVDVLCGARGFHPLYLFYNRYGDPSSSRARMRLAFEGCTVASGKRVRRRINPGLNGNDELVLDNLISLQLAWWVLVCPSDPDQATLADRAVAAVRQLGSVGASPEDPPDPDDVAVSDWYRELDGPYRALWDARARAFSLAEGIGEIARPVIILSA